MHKITCKDKILDLSTPAIMGILNLTPDSFYDGGRHNSENDILIMVTKMLQDGADIIDIGAISTRPGAKNVKQEEELLRIIPSVKLIRKQFPEIIISVDTWRSSVAQQCIDQGADIINDISGGSFDADILDTVKKNDVPFIMMHIQGRPSIMQNNPVYDNVIKDISGFFEKQIRKLGGYEKIILDPGIGFGKSLEHNYEILAGLKEFQKFGLPLLLGLSRKSLINKVLKTNPEHALNGTTALNTIALLNGANILRVHDVKEAVEVKKLVLQYQKEK